MHRNYSLLCFFNISVYFLTGSVIARETIIGGSFARLHDFQYQATIVFRNQAPRCGGGVIKDKFILTVAHCIIGIRGALIDSELFVFVGTVDLEIPGTVRDVEKVYVPREYDPTVAIPLGNIAVLELQEALDFERHHLNLQLPEHEGQSYARAIAKIAGFGWDMLFANRMEGQNVEHRLRFADVKVRTRVKCERDHPYRNFDDKYFCARIMQLNRNAHRGTCNGDEGGPLVYEEKTAIGVLSIPTNDCKEGESSAIYTNVAYYRHFILNAIHNNVTNLQVIEV